MRIQIAQRSDIEACCVIRIRFSTTWRACVRGLRHARDTVDMTTPSKREIAVKAINADFAQLTQVVGVVSGTADKK